MCHSFISVKPVFERTAVQHLLQCLPQDRLVFPEACQVLLHLCVLMLKLLHRGLQEAELLLEFGLVVEELLGCLKLSVLLLFQALEKSEDLPSSRASTCDYGVFSRDADLLQDLVSVLQL